jgi:hypothetical protein
MSQSPKYSPGKYSFDVSPMRRSILQTQKFDVNDPFVIFTTGPTGSGKSGLVRKTIQRLYPSIPVTNYESFILDDLIEKNDTYKQLINDILDKYDCRTSIDVGSRCNIQNPSQELIKDMNDAYWKIRQDKGYCGVASESCDDLFNSQWKQAIREGKNIVIETTGRVIPWWFIKYFHTLSSKQYNIIFTYAVASFDILIQRNINRAMTNIKQFIDNGDNNAPRLPDISRTNFKKATDTILKTLITLRNICLRLGKSNDIRCGNDEQTPPNPTNLINNKGKYVLLIFDNNNRSKLIYDSRSRNDNMMTNGEFVTLLSRFALNNEKEGGGIKTKRKYVKKSRSIKKGMRGFRTRSRYGRHTSRKYQR